MKTPFIFELSHGGRTGYRYPELDVETAEALPDVFLRRNDPELPEISEVDLVRHYTALSRRNYGVDLGFYPLGSCTMKYNPKMNEDIARLPGFTDLHPCRPAASCQGILQLLRHMEQLLCEITGMAAGTMQPYAGAQGEFTGMKLFKAYFRERREEQRRVILVPDSAHGTNPASAHLAGFDVVEIKTSEQGGGRVSVEDIAPYLNENLAGIMMTNPNTLGLFENDIIAIAGKVHDAGGLLYYDGANLNAIMGKTRPGDMGFDVIHMNLHKTFSTPHGGGGPGAGPVFVAKKLIPFLPGPQIEEREDGTFAWDVARKQSIGRMAMFHGNIGVVIRAYAYILFMGSDGLAAVSERAVLNANYLKERLKKVLELPYDRICMHEFVLSARELKESTGVSALDLAKGLLDRGYHAPTVYFPLIVPEALMIEPTETESRETLDAFAAAVEEICREAQSDAEAVHAAPLNTPVRRVDEVLAARKPVVRWHRGEGA